MNDVADPRDASFKDANPNEDGRIEVKGGILHELADQLEQVLIDKPEAGVYQRGGYLVEIGTVPDKHQKDVTHAQDAYVIVPVTTTRARDIATRFSGWKKWDARKDGFKSIDCPKEVADTLLCRSTSQLPVLVAVLGAPTMTPDGKLIGTPGFDARSGVYLHMNDWQKLKKKKPTHDDAVAARQLLEDLVSEFPFTDDAARATWLAALLTALIRWSLRTAPFFGFDAPVMGSGKSLLGALIGCLVTGHDPAVMAQPKDENEAAKKMLAVLMAGDPVLLIDNIEHAIVGEVLCSVATSETYSDRLLGQTKKVTVSTAVTIMMTGNNLIVRGDLSTRMLIARLDAGIEHPEERSFKRADIRQYALAHRQELVNAALTILQAHHLAGRPECGLKPFGRFEDWSHRVRAPLVWSGAADPCETRSRIENIDPEREMHAQLLTAWWANYGPKEVILQQIVHDCTSGKPDFEELMDAITLIAAEGKKINTMRLARRVSKWESRIAAGFRVIRGGIYTGRRAWRLEKVSGLVSGGMVDKGCSSTGTRESVRNLSVSSGTIENHPKATEPTGQSVSGGYGGLSQIVQEILQTACAGLQLTPEELFLKFSSDDFADIESGRMSADDLRTWAEMFDQETKK